ncbi:hypothetical protein CHU92_10795 [Flavobacterium cyanobacteriorum]|uniref:Right handed beta helix domain-containing protein n=1 Tax=Flavobacterium cyanobacteriorum TaxID=2022802 RepID=A0A255Z1V4_9FLAO|nr:choice-of-anchor Q domain-containing protein [Flavobacterium cyanobacteriorum]OYQ35456.1 hypothetical protein CHU92_10795 [Flavobacterium cyanobacteriorum]
MRQYVLFLLIIAGLSLISCRDDFEFEPSGGGLEFSRDTVYLDTVFTNIGSSTYTLKVYNRSNRDISIPSVKLKRPDSKYRLMVDGMSGQSFENVELLAKDSMFIFIETTVDVAEANPDDFLYTDELQFFNTNGVQEVHLVTLIQDAIFLYPQRFDDGSYESIPLNPGEPDRIYGFYLDENDPNHGNELRWTNEKPYVIYGYAAVPPGKTLIVDPGARVHFHADSGLLVSSGATIAAGNANNPPTEAGQIVFEGDRLEPRFAETPGQWGTVWLRNGSTANTMSNIIIKNATVGLLVEGNDGTPETLKLRNMQVYNCSNVGILARNGHITATNLVVNKAGEASLGLTFGGIYNFTHCTIANYFNNFNQFPLVLNDYRETSSTIEVTDLNAQFINCIFFGLGNRGISLENKGIQASTPPVFGYQFQNCLIKFFDFSNEYASNPLYQFNGPNYPGSKRARNSSENRPQFRNPQNNDLRISEGSAAVNAGFDAGVPVDILGNPRNGAPDIGAYEFVSE